MTHPSEKRWQIWLPTAFAAVLVLGMYVGSRMYDASFSKIGLSLIVRKDKVYQLLEYINQRYVDSVSKTALENAAIENLLKQLDPYSTYITAEEFRQSSISLEGNFEGIGIEFFIVEDTIMVINVIADGPSAVMGLLPGDRIVSINGENVAGTGITNEEVISRLRGPRGTKVTVNIKRSRVDSLLVFTITRDRIPLHSLEASFMIDDSVGFIKLSRFSATTHNEFKQALLRLKNKGMKHLVLDLRDNSGGYLHAATQVANEFLAAGKLIVYTEGRKQPRQEYRANGKGAFQTGKVVILINEWSASASEIVTGALQDWDRATIVGRRSFGKGLVQEQFVFADSSAIRLTVARYYTPLGRSIQKPYPKKAINKYPYEQHKGGSYTPIQMLDTTLLSDTLRYFTPAGKVVYGGGGIVPDVLVALDTTTYSDFLNAVVSRNLIQQFAYTYVATHRPVLQHYANVQEFAREFIPSGHIFNAFIQYARQHRIVPDRQHRWKQSVKKIQTLLTAYMAKHLWDNNAFYSLLLKDDIAFIKAYEVVRQMNNPDK